MNDQQESTPAETETKVADESVIRRALGETVDIVYTDEGWDSRVYLVDDGEAVFKFARTPEIRRQYEHEVAAMRLLESIDSPVATPRVVWEGPDLSYIGYRGIVGDQLARGLAQLSPREKTRIGSELGTFLRGLHGAELPGARRTDVGAKVGEYREKYDLARPALAAAFSERELDAIERFVLAELPAGLRQCGSEARLCHGDLGPWNIIVTPDGGVGVIDFGDVAYEDPAVDFSGFGDDVVLRTALDAYGAPDRLRESAALRSRALPILDIPFYLGKHDEEGLRRCIDLVRRVLVDGETPPGARYSRD